MAIATAEEKYSKSRGRRLPYPFSASSALSVAELRIKESDLVVDQVDGDGRAAE